ncbi:tetratricopeptide repeat protein [Stenotrophomonas sp. Iso1]|uniref:tetratricopeptide repeat protein n=1 Tax=Stenotrophomonas sp. Iso1 TaxID=2977283 RepID=UPI0022B79B53|nr:tetratricopeptide repeat protein [Stenotrophomonas sp. Iso1]
MDVKAVGAVACRPMMVLVLLSGLVACASAPKKPVVVPFDTTMSNAEAQVATVTPDASIKAFEDAAKSDPTRKEPWVRIAQLQFDQGNYARAIVAAEEVLQRDPDDLVADGVITVAGFRVANQSLQRLQGRGALASETARKEAQTLADTLRSTMGDAVLAVEKPKPRARAGTRAGARRQAASTAAPSTPAPTPAPAPARQTRGDNADPFQNIGN